jgi:hypothetical protein
VEDFARHPHLRRITVDTRAGTVSMPRPPARGLVEAMSRAVPAVGAHSAALRRDFAG